MIKVNIEAPIKPTLEFPNLETPTLNVWAKLREKFRDHRLGTLISDEHDIKGIYIGPHLEIIDSTDGPVLRFKKS